MGESHQVLIKALDPAAGDTNASLASTKETMMRVLFKRQLPVSCLSRKSGFVFAAASHIVRYQRRSTDGPRPALMRQLWMLVFEL